MPTDSLAITNELNCVSVCISVQQRKCVVPNLSFSRGHFLSRRCYPDTFVQTFCFVPPQSEAAVTHGCIQSLLLKFSAQELIEVRQSTSSSSPTTSSSTSSSTVVIAVDHTKLWAMIGPGAGAQRTGVKRKAEDQSHNKRAPGSSPSLQIASSPPRSSSTSLTPASSSQQAGPSASGSGAEKKGRSSKNQSSHLDMEIESLLNQQSTKEQQSKKVLRSCVLKLGEWG